MTVKAYKVKSFHNGGTHDFLAFNQLSNVSASVRKKNNLYFDLYLKTFMFQDFKIEEGRTYFRQLNLIFQWNEMFFISFFSSLRSCLLPVWCGTRLKRWWCRRQVYWHNICLSLRVDCIRFHSHPVRFCIHYHVNSDWCYCRALQVNRIFYNHCVYIRYETIILVSFLLSLNVVFYNLWMFCVKFLQILLFYVSNDKATPDDVLY